jgi:hypothetical protein
MKRYLLFYGDTYYPDGGWGDYAGDFDSLAESIKEANASHREWDWAHVVNSSERGIVAYANSRTMQQFVDSGTHKPIE